MSPMAYTYRAGIRTEACGKARWRGALDAVETGLRQVSDGELWRLRCTSRQRLVEFLRGRLQQRHHGRGMAAEWRGQCVQLLDPDVLTLGFARRFAEYKRTNLLLHDRERLLRLLLDRDHPVQLVIAGKAHPRDAEGKRMLREWQNFLEQPEVCGRAVFVEDYDLEVARQLTQGVDVWINTPRRPWEASGTSGMKVLVNGGLNLSELDGWWAEAFAPEVGWGLGDGREHTDSAAWDGVEAEQLFQLLESEVVPCFHRRDESGLPREWVNRMRESMACLTPRFSSNRMMREYVEEYYLPLADAYRRRGADAAVKLQEWYGMLSQHWPRIHFGNVTWSKAEAGYRFEVQVYLNDMPLEAVSVELYADPTDGGEPYRQTLQRGTLLAGTTNAFVYHASVPTDRPATDYTPRVIPANAGAVVPLEAGFITWYR